MIIGLDVGGTHTDVVLLDSHGLLRAVKVPTDLDDLFPTVLSGIDKITSQIDIQSIQRVVLSTTLTTNAVAQHRIPPVGMIVCAGPGIDPECYRPNPDYHVVSGAMDHRGRETVPLNLAQIKDIARRLAAAGIHHVGVVGKFSVRNPAHELTIARVLSPIFENVFLGHRFSGSLNFGRRVATTYLNAAVCPLHKTFFEAVEKSLAQKGITVPIRILKADGGNMNFAASKQSPGQTILSGPAASVMGAVAFAPRDHTCLVLDIGGTTTDMALLVDGTPLINPHGVTLGKYKTLIRSLETTSLAIGGDSVIRVIDGRLKIGPLRRGAALAFGGPAPTPTDALVALGKMPADNAGRSIRGMASLADRLGLSLEATAQKVLDQTSRTILAAAREMIASINAAPVYTVHEVWEGRRIEPQRILILGGPATYFTKPMARLSGWPAETIPRWEVANAMGAALARTTCTVNLFCDTERRVAFASEENFEQAVDRKFGKAAAKKLAYDLLSKKALARGADREHLEMEVIEALEFNMVRGFNTVGKNIRITAQVKPGLIHGHGKITDTIRVQSQKEMSVYRED